MEEGDWREGTRTNHLHMYGQLAFIVNTRGYKVECSIRLNMYSVMPNMVGAGPHQKSHEGGVGGKQGKGEAMKLGCN